MQIIDLLQKLISYPTVTPSECGIYKYIQEFLPNFRAIRWDREGVSNLFLYHALGGSFYEDFLASQKSQKDSNLEYLRFLSKQNLTHLCFAGHVDVVPPGHNWATSPFEGVKKEGFVFGRGAQDMKGGIAAFLYALKTLLDFPPKDSLAKSKGFILSVLLTSDEEGEAVFGTQYVLHRLYEENFLPQYVIVAEPTCSDALGDTVKIGRRGSINGSILIMGKQGHVAYPEKCLNPVELLGSKLGNIAGKNLDEGDEYFSPSKLVVTDIRGGMQAVNVTPSNLNILFNVRNNSLTNEKSIREYISEVLEGLEYELSLKTNSLPFLTHSKVGEGEIDFLYLLEECIFNICGRKPLLSTSGGTSDARFFAQCGCRVIEFGVCNDTIHAVNERVRIKDVECLSEIFLDFIKKMLESDS